MPGRPLYLSPLIFTGNLILTQSPLSGGGGCPLLLWRFSYHEAMADPSLPPHFPSLFTAHPHYISLSTFFLLRVCRSSWGRREELRWKKGRESFPSAPFCLWVILNSVLMSEPQGLFRGLTAKPYLCSATWF